MIKRILLASALFALAFSGLCAEGLLPVDGSNHPIPIAASIKTQDATATPIVSPKTSLGTTPLAFTTPANAMVLVFRVSAAARYGDNSMLSGSGTGNGYRVASSGSDVVVPCTDMSAVYIRAESGTITVDFHYEMRRQ